MENPIKDNRMVSDTTFAVRMLNFLRRMYPDAASDHPAFVEEYEYMVRTARDMLKYQIATCTDKNERDYIDRVAAMSENGELSLHLIDDDSFDFNWYMNKIQ